MAKNKKCLIESLKEEVRALGQRVVAMDGRLTISSVESGCFLLVVRDGIEPEKYGPFKTNAVRNRFAKLLHKESGDNDLFMGVDARLGDFDVWSYSGDFFSKRG